MGNDDIMGRILPEEVIREKGLAALAAEKEAIYREIYAPEIRPVEGLRELLGTAPHRGRPLRRRLVGLPGQRRFQCWRDAASATSSTPAFRATR